MGELDNGDDTTTAHVYRYFVSYRINWQGRAARDGLGFSVIGGQESEAEAETEAKAGRLEE